MSISQYIISANIKSDIPPREYVSPSGLFKLVVTTYNSRKGAWDVTRGQVFDKEGNQLFDIHRNYSVFWHLFIPHPNGNEYLLYGEDYHGGYGCINLTNKTRQDYKSKDFTWCFIDAIWLADTQEIKAEGCYWACPYEYAYFDFSNPDAPLPWNIVKWEDPEFEDD